MRKTKRAGDPLPQGLPANSKPSIDDGDIVTHSRIEFLRDILGRLLTTCIVIAEAANNNSLVNRLLHIKDLINHGRPK